MKNVVSREAWLEARKAFLAREKAFDRERDALSEARRALPRVKVDKEYVFEERSGKRTLSELFEGRKQLIVYHFMFAPEWEAGCKSCSFVADNFANSIVHLAARDTSFAVISRAPLAKIEAFHKRMGWKFRWLSSGATDFNFDFHVSFTPEELAKGAVEYNYAERPWGASSEAPGASVFLREGDAVLHTYSTYGRGLDHLLATYDYLDLTPLGRQEESLPYPMAWIRHRDRYE
jgi:predicted dithiol-disulfide oxidoreductase (DUF899 family)